MDVYFEDRRHDYSIDNLDLKKFMTFYQICVDKVMILLILLLIAQGLKDMSLMIIKIVIGGHTLMVDIMV